MPTPGPGLKRVPRWRTMISPPLTLCPANTLTPRYLGLESRPLRLDPRPFLCAICRLRGNGLIWLGGSGLGRRCLRRRRSTGARRELERGDLDPGQILAMTVAPLV